MKIENILKRNQFYETFEQEQMMKEDTGRYNKTYLPWLCFPNPRRQKKVCEIPDGYESDFWVPPKKHNFNWLNINKKIITPLCVQTAQSGHLSSFKTPTSWAGMNEERCKTNINKFRIPEITYQHEYNADNYHYYPDEFDAKEEEEDKDNEKINFEIITNLNHNSHNNCDFTLYKKSHEFVNNYCMKISGTHHIKKCLDCYYEPDENDNSCCNGYYFTEKVSHSSNIILSSKNNLLFSKMLFHILKNIKHKILSCKIHFKEYITLLQMKKYELQPFIKKIISHLNFKLPSVLVDFVVEFI